MPKITDTPPSSVQKELVVLQKDLDEKIPAKKLDRNVLICTCHGLHCISHFVI